ncbi:hypothetical protein TetV_296 [Tetraselmis virus 1]|uniref:Uncharacterized protein n=1 Tax=Tetraselmis virus 1 TaxID=2060617 RepID=A0A2P0VNA7_9VIRU|nr:hypothetical protein QJ968_gp296 [Tetraselmis virus 1]AUF82388.1 hypothetical protein TetV_296 [Tetraselmis virus 1]
MEECVKTKSSSSFKKIIKSIVESIANECDAEMSEAKLVFGNTIREHLVSPVLQKVYKDLFPYVCAVVVVLIIILIFVLLLMFLLLTRGLLR